MFQPGPCRWLQGYAAPAETIHCTDSAMGEGRYSWRQEAWQELEEKDSGAALPALNPNWLDRNCRRASCNPAATVSGFDAPFRSEPVDPCWAAIDGQRLLASLSDRGNNGVGPLETDGGEEHLAPTGRASWSVNRPGSVAADPQPEWSPQRIGRLAAPGKFHRRCEPTERLLMVRLDDAIGIDDETEPAPKHTGVLVRERCRNWRLFFLRSATSGIGNIHPAALAAVG